MTVRSPGTPPPTAFDKTRFLSSNVSTMANCIFTDPRALKDVSVFLEYSVSQGAC